MSDQGGKRPLIAMALGGGGALGIAHLGVLKVLHEYGIEPDFVAGTSAGAMVGACYCSGMPMDEVIRLSLELDWPKLRKRTFPSFALFTNEPMREYLDSILPVKTFAELKTPLRVVATDLCTAQLVVIEDQPRPLTDDIWQEDEIATITGDLLDAVRASCTVPVIFKPVELAGRLLVDGGMICNVPAGLARQMGADIVIAIDLVGRWTTHRRPRNILQYVAQTAAIRTTWAIRNRRIYADVVLQPDLSSFQWDSFARSQQVLEAGIAVARERIGEIMLAIQAAQATLAGGE